MQTLKGSGQSLLIFGSFYQASRPGSIREFVEYNTFEVFEVENFETDLLETEVIIADVLG